MPANKVCYVNGVYLTPKVSGGAKRVACEVMDTLARAKTDIKFIVLCPKDAEVPKNDGNVEYRTVGKFTGNKWEQISLARYVNKNKGLCLSLCNSFPAYAKRNIAVVFDVRPKEELNSGIKNRFIKKFDFLMRRAKKTNVPVVTISEFSKDRICQLYSYKKDLVHIVRLGHEHCCRFNGGDGKDGEYYLSVSSVSKHKNFDYILDLAELHGDKYFYIIGNKCEELNRAVPANVVFLGKLSDAELAEYYKNAKAFISSSLYEGFGLTPLEAIYYGCKSVYLSDIPVFKEVFSSVASFFNPHSAKEFNFDAVRIISGEERDKLLKNYSWANCADDLLKVVEKYL